MGKALLVNLDLEAGSEVLRAIEAAGIRVSVALWAKLEEYADWRLIVASRDLDAAGMWDGYMIIIKATRAAGIPQHKSDSLMILRMKDPFIRELRKLFKGAKDVEGMRLGGQAIGDRFLEDAYVYRIS
ncbi:MAG TPA: hypothetical protein VKX45_23740 [Bryobacteraceae bacterium]|jgi:hypothetical protein|nr:hypothetical protein [Bryobacteraceae bacterium]